MRPERGTRFPKLVCKAGLLAGTQYLRRPSRQNHFTRVDFLPHWRLADVLVYHFANTAEAENVPIGQVLDNTRHTVRTHADQFGVRYRAGGAGAGPGDAGGACGPGAGFHVPDVDLKHPFEERGSKIPSQECGDFLSAIFSTQCARWSHDLGMNGVRGCIQQFDVDRNLKTEHAFN